MEKEDYEQDWVAVERIYPLNYSDIDGNEIHYYAYTVVYLERDQERGVWHRVEDQAVATPAIESKPSMLHEKVLDPATAEASRSCMVGEIPGFLYDKGGRRYLWWTPETGTTLVLDYDPDIQSEADMFRMAESVGPVV